MKLIAKPLNNLLKPFYIALQWLTRIPVPAMEEQGKRDKLAQHHIAFSSVYYPLVGLVIGLILVANYFLFMQFFAFKDFAIPASILLCLWVGLTGGLHLDGLADSADAWLGGSDKDHTLAIMKDPSCGPAAVIVLLLLLLLKFSALVTLLASHEWIFLLIAPIWGRASVLILLLSTPYVSKGGSAEVLSQYLPRMALKICLAVVLGLSLWVLHWHGIYLLIALVVAMAALLWFLRSLMLKRIAGITGDTLGAAVEITEALVLMIAALATLSI